MARRKDVEEAMTAAPDLDARKREVCETVERMRSDLVRLSREIHACPELAFEERFASARLVETLRSAGLEVTTGAYGLATAFAAEFGASDGPCVAVLAEYDALPEIGHACGHNLIATAGIGAGIALARLGVRLPGRVRVLGTPAEEHGCGKELMAREGAFSGVDAAIMMHPSSINLVNMPCVCMAEVDVVYRGQAAHAAAMPDRGVNALDALVLAYQGIAALRQHIRSATGAELELRWGAADYLDIRYNEPLASAFRSNAEQLGREFFPYDKLPSSLQGSTDMGNVSQRIPSIHPMLAAAPPHCTIHNPEFAKWAGSEMGDAAAIDGAKALAMTALDFLGDPALRERTRAFFGAGE
jgi:metal-dependent amidase/aminoacylase/carboxypeptidase family protein